VIRRGDEPTQPTVVGHQRLDAPLKVNPGGSTVSWHPDDTPSDADGAAPGPLLRRVAQFVLLERLGAGGMGVVFAAFDEKLERKVAIKLVATGGGSERAQQRLLREAQAQGRLSHPNVVTVYEVGTLPEGELFIAMELVKGDTLRAWQEAGPRAWPEIVAHYVAAGAGLAAAHRAGIVHRDFKPDNVLIGDDGRVRVADFGLAFASEVTPAPDLEQPRTSSRDSRPALTVAGAVVGTPGYMAPEQFAGATVDARTDQFSFCVALYEALHGERPNADHAFASGARPPLRRSEPDPAYPRWLWDVVVRGLAHDPDARFPSMDALLVELTRSRARTRRRALVGGALLGVLVTAGVASAALLGGRAPEPCPRPVGELAGVWDPLTKPRIHAALLATGAPFAAAVWTSTEAAFDRYATRWVDAQQAACAATHVRHVQSPELLDRRVECLAGRRRSLAAAAEVLQTRPAQAVAHAGEVLASLGDIDLCADTGVLLQLGPTASSATPTGALAQAKATEVRSQLAKATALLATRDVAAAEPRLREAQILETVLHDDAVRAELRYVESRVKLLRGAVAESIRLANESVELAVATHNDELPADVWLNLVVSASSLEQRPTEIEMWLRQGDAWLRRLGHENDARRIIGEHARAKLALTAGHANESLATLSQAIVDAERLWGDRDPRLAALLRDRAIVHARLGHAKPAVADGERSLELGIAAWGPEYPDIASTRRVLGLMYLEQLGQIDRGEQEISIALQLYRNQLGSDSLEVANCEQALSQVGQYRGDYRQALEHAERAERIYAKRLGADHPRHGEALMGLGVLRFMRRDFAGSLAAYKAAFPSMQTALGPNHTSVALLLSNTGETELALGHADAAQPNFEKALAIFTRELGPEHADLALPLKGLGLAQLDRGRPRDAIPYLEKALALRTQSAAANDPQEVAEIRWGLARALRATRQASARVATLARDALDGYRALGADWATRVQEIERWTSGLGKPP
jgi:tetratricopeptide (TPR) repeat protein